jgi:hypothetical protein
MLLLLATAAMAASAPAALVPDRSPALEVGRNPNGLADPLAGSRSCPPIGRYETRRSAGRPKLRRLNELPPADAYKAVYRRVGGCIAPIVVRTRIGSR